jgi:hypothetical protein
VEFTADLQEEIARQVRDAMDGPDILPEQDDEDAMITQLLQAQMDNQRLQQLLTAAYGQIKAANAARNEALQKAKQAAAAAQHWQDEAERRSGTRAFEHKQQSMLEYATEENIEAPSFTSQHIKTLFTGLLLFTAALAVLNAYARAAVFAECVRWFTGLGGVVKACALWLYSSFFRFKDEFSVRLPDLPAALYYAAPALLYLCAAAVLVYLLVRLVKMLRKTVPVLGRQYKHGAYKAVLTISVVISIFYACVFLYEPIKRLLPFNIFTVWLLLALLGAAAVNYKELRAAFRERKRTEELL